MNRIMNVIKTAVKSKGYFALLLFFYLVCVGIFVLYSSQNDIVPVSTTKKELPIYGVNTEEKKVALSFDAAWGNEDTQIILEILKKHEVKVTFFMTGGWVEKYPDDVKAIHAAGHDLGNHSENHKHMTELNHTDCVEEIMSVHEKVAALTGENMCLFRPPYGDYNDGLIKSCDSVGYYTIQWDVDTHPTRVKLDNIYVNSEEEYTSSLFS